MILNPMWASVQHVTLLVSSTSQQALSALNLWKSTVIDLSVGAYFGFVCFVIWFLTLAILFDSWPHSVARIESFFLEIWDSFQILIRSKRLVQLRLKMFFVIDVVVVLGSIPQWMFYYLFPNVDVVQMDVPKWNRRTCFCSMISIPSYTISRWMKIRERENMSLHYQWRSLFTVVFWSS